MNQTSYKQVEALQFKELKLEQNGSWLKQKLSSKHIQKTIMYSVIGAAIGFALFYFDQNENSKVLWNSVALKNVLGGIGFGIFITNSPCARGKC